MSNNKKAHAKLRKYTTWIVGGVALLITLTALRAYFFALGVSGMLVIPIAVTALVLCRFGHAFIAFSALMFVIVALATIYQERFAHGSQTNFLYAMGPLLLLSVAARLQTVYGLFPPRVLVERLDATTLNDELPTSGCRSLKSFRIAELGSLVVLPIALIGSFALLKMLESDTPVVGPTFGVLPQTYLVAKVVVVVGVSVLLVRGAIGFVRSVLANQRVSSIDLRGETWAWNRKEQSLVARQVHKTKASSQEH